MFNCFIQGYWDQNKTLLSRYLNSKPIVPTLPLLIINPLNADADTVHEKLSVKELMDNEIVSEVRIDSLDNTIDYSNQVGRLVYSPVFGHVVKYCKECETEKRNQLISDILNCRRGFILQPAVVPLDNIMRSVNL